jgi:DeoR family glycerol-3-phosphate regulon repressor
LHQQQRDSVILAAVSRRGQCSVLDLAGELGVSDETVRRDLKRLQAAGLVRKVHGGVTQAELNGEARFRLRLDEQAAAKRAIARRAAAEVRDGDSVMLDTGTSTLYVARALVERRNLRVVTNCVDIARLLVARPGNQVFMAGGELREDDGAALGPSAAAFVEQFRVRLAFLSMAAIDLEDGPMDFHLAEAEFSRVVMRRAERTIVVADHSKFGRRALVSVCPLSAVQAIITDRPPSALFAARLEHAEVMVAEG